ncbi:MAG: hypothetical protein JO152_13525 [Mycobacteriaceae bacterium]|nr:hypothetical protein [Mycobacteriaceae bacterium]
MTLNNPDRLNALSIDRTQILAGSGGAFGEAVAAHKEHRRPSWANGRQ